MVPAWTVTLSYIGYAAMLLLGAAVWLTALFESVVYSRVQMARLDQRWLDFAYKAMSAMYVAIWAAIACAVAACVLAALPAPDSAPLAKAHKAYQLRHGAIAAILLLLLALSRHRMGALDAEVGAVVLFAWSLWVVAAGWLAYGGGTPVTGPALWWLALVVDVLLLGLFAVFWIMLEIEGIRMI